MKHAGGRSLRGGRSKHQEQCGCCCIPPSLVLPYLAYHQLWWGLQQVGSSQPARNKRFNAGAALECTATRRQAKRPHNGQHPPAKRMLHSTT